VSTGFATAEVSPPARPRRQRPRHSSGDDAPHDLVSVRPLRLRVRVRHRSRGGNAPKPDPAPAKPCKTDDDRSPRFRRGSRRWTTSCTHEEVEVALSDQLAKLTARAKEAETRAAEVRERPGRTWSRKSPRLAHRRGQMQRACARASTPARRRSRHGGQERRADQRADPGHNASMNGRAASACTGPHEPQREPRTPVAARGF
jgi:hypothetical protein